MADMPTLEAVQKSAANVSPESVRNVMFMGAETLLRRDAAEVLGGFKARGFDGIGIATNGTALTDPGRFQQLLDAGLSYLEISIHSLVPDHAAEISGRGFTHRKQMECLALLDRFAAEQPLNVTINTVVCSMNVNDVSDLITTIARDFPHIVPHHQIKAAMPTPSAVKNGILARWSDVRASGMVEAIAPELHPRIAFTDFPLCALHPHPHLSANLTSYLSADAYVYLSHEIEGGSDWLTDTRKSFGEACGRCAMRPLCSGIAPEYVALHGPDAFKPIDADPERAFFDVVQWRRAHDLPMSPIVADDPSTAFKKLRQAVEGAPATRVSPEEARRTARVERFVAAYLGGDPSARLGEAGDVEIVEVGAPGDKERYDIRLRAGNGEVRAYVELAKTGRNYMRTRFLSLSYYSESLTLPQTSVVQALTVLGKSLARRERMLTEASVGELFRR